MVIYVTKDIFTSMIIVKLHIRLLKGSKINNQTNPLFIGLKDYVVATIKNPGSFICINMKSCL